MVIFGVVLGIAGVLVLEVLFYTRNRKKMNRTKIGTFRRLPIEECKSILNGMQKEYKVIKWEVFPYYTREKNKRELEEMKIFFYDMVIEYKGE